MLGGLFLIVLEIGKCKVISLAVWCLVGTHLLDCCLLLYPQKTKEVGLSVASFIRADSIYEGSIFMTSTPLKGLTSSFHHLGTLELGFQNEFVEGDNKQSEHSRISSVIGSYQALMGLEPL